MKTCLITLILLLSFGLSSQIIREFLTLKPVVSAGYPPGTVHCLGSPTAVVDVVGLAGRTWMDRNLGASQVATSSTDMNAYGDLYQWGRFSDGHQCRTSAITTTNSGTDTPGHGDFIRENISPGDWRTTQNDTLWQFVSGYNNPCPIGYRLPTATEWNTERTSWAAFPDAADAFASLLKLPVGGYRRASDGIGAAIGVEGWYWSSSRGGSNATRLLFQSSGSGSGGRDRAEGSSVRCIKE